MQNRGWLMMTATKLFSWLTHFPCVDFGRRDLAAEHDGRVSQASCPPLTLSRFGRPF